MLIILEQDPSVKTTDFCDEFVSAEIPDMPDSNDKSAAAQQQRDLHDLVTRLNLHDHDKTSSCMADGKCSKYFPKKFSPLTILSESDFPIYKRRGPPGPDQTKTDSHGNTFLKTYGNTSLKMYAKTGKTILLDNRFVVPYNAFLLLKYSSHLNLEHVAAQESMEYTFKYIMKGHDMAYVRVQNDLVVNYDKMDNIMQCRYMAGIEGYWNISGFPIVHCSHPVIRQWIKGPKGQPIIFHEGYEREGLGQIESGGKKTMVQAFFDLCCENSLTKTLTYDKVGKHFKFNDQEGKWYPRKKRDPSKIIVRVGSVSPRNRELFCIRILLFNVVSPTSFENLRTVEGVVYPTFEEACKIRNLFG
uniref:Uncharacterized protein n=1 Tax=Romanomermis culicivorax TaxID=13658 RepID=A0A915KAD6_ROMCU